MRVGYVVSRFPHVTETFVLREFAAVDRVEGMSVELFSLFPAVSGTVHPAARPWLGRLFRPRPSNAARALAYWAGRSPAALLRVFCAVLWDYRRNPRVLVRALATVPVAAGIALEAERRNIDHLHAHFATYPALAAWIAHRLTHITFSITPHAHDLFIHHSGLTRRFRDAVFVVAISQYNRGYLTALAGPKLNAPVVRYGVDMERYPPRGSTAVVRSCDDSAPIAICVSSFRDYKGHRFLIHALALGRNSPLLGALTLQLVGDGPLRNEIERLVRELELDERVAFLGPQTEDRVAELIRASDVLIQPSIVAPSGDTEGLPNTLIEALAASVPAVATRVAGIPELVREGEQGGLLTQVTQRAFAMPWKGRSAILGARLAWPLPAGKW